MQSVTSKMAGYWSRSFSRLYGSRRTQDVNKNAEEKERKKERKKEANIQQSRLNKYGQKETKGKRRD